MSGEQYATDKEVIPVPSLKPDFVSFPVSGLTATIGLDVQGRIQHGDKVLITASAGGTGHIAVQWAKKKSCHVIGRTSSEEKAKLLKELRTDRVINYKTEDLDEVLTKEYPVRHIYLNNNIVLNFALLRSYSRALLSVLMKCPNITDVKIKIRVNGEVLSLIVRYCHNIKSLNHNTIQ